MTLLYANFSFGKEINNNLTNNGFANIVEPLLPGVVNISTTKNTGTKNQQEIIPESPFSDFFQQFFDSQDYIKRKPKKARSLGSGFIIESSGYIVTNNHVIANADEIFVTLPSNEELEIKAKIIGKDPRTDLALLKITTDKKLTSLNWGDSTKARVGDWIIAIGNPFGLGSTVTSGIISNIARDVTIGPAQYIEGFLQIDAAVNSGNSGGPLFNSEGKIIGVVNAIATTTGGNIGIGFAIPSEIAISTIKQLREFGQTRRGCLGIGVLQIGNEKAKYYGLKKAQGAEINEINKNGPAYKAGLKIGDIIIEFNGKKIKSFRQLPRMVGETPIGQKIPIIVWRNGKRKLLSVKIEQYEKK